MNSSCSMGTFDQGPSHIPWTIHKSNLYFQTTVMRQFRISQEKHPKNWTFWQHVSFHKQKNYSKNAGKSAIFAFTLTFLIKGKALIKGEDGNFVKTNNRGGSDPAQKDRI